MVFLCTARIRGSALLTTRSQGAQPVSFTWKPPRYYCPVEPLFGVGTERKLRLTNRHSPQTVFLWQCFFLSGYVWIKCSICVTLLRIALHKVHRTILWVLIIISVVSTVFVQLYVVLQCRPIAASWGEEAGVCASKTITVTITFVISAFNLVTDVITAVLPFIIIKDIQMTRRKKQAVIAVLSLGVLASIATIARLPYATAYFATTDVMGT